MPEMIEYIELRFPDILGQLKSMTIPCNPVSTIDELGKDAIMGKGTSVDGSSVAGLSAVESSDLRLVPDPAALVELPYSERRAAAVMCFVKERLGSEKAEDFYPKDTRGLLHSVCQKYLPGEMQLKVKVEPEFHFITQDGLLYDYGGYADTFPQNPAAEILLDIATAIQSMGMKPRVIHHEVGNSQQEIEIEYENAMKMADFVLMFKNVTRRIARTRSLDVTFMPKPFPATAGNGLHCHLQLWDGKKNLFGQEGGDGLSNTARMFIAGLLEHAPAITAIGNSTVNSYKRLVPHQEAPVFITWGLRNRTTLVRVPLFADPQKAALEFRSADPMTNPYLLFSVLIAAGMDGIKRELAPPEARTEDVFHLSEDDLHKYGIKTLPSNLSEALNQLEEDSVIQNALTDELIEAFMKIKREEWKEYVNEIVTDWEWQRYQPF